jgi:Leucine-rich repeat (LRR) protein
MHKLAVSTLLSLFLYCLPVLASTPHQAVNSPPSANTLISDVVFADANLQACVLNRADNRGWTLIEQVDYVGCEKKNINDLEGLQAFTAITSLYLSGNNISDITVLSSLTQL